MRNRPTSELLIMMIAGTICFSVLATGATVAVVKLLHPEVDTSGTVNSLTDVINTMIGLLAGFLAGRTDATQQALKEHQDKARQQRESAE